MNKKAAAPKEVGRRYSRRNVIASESGGELIPFDPEVFHHFHSAPDRYKRWALDYLERHDVSANDVIAKASSDGFVNEGTPLREHVESMPATNHDDGAALAARIYELCRKTEIFQMQPELFRPGEGLQTIFELGRLSMLARVYGIDDEVIRDRVEKAKKTNVKYAPEEKAKWREVDQKEFSGHSVNNAAKLIAKRLDLPDEAIETIRRALTPRKKLGKALCFTSGSKPQSNRRESQRRETK